MDLITSTRTETVGLETLGPNLYLRYRDGRVDLLDGPPGIGVYIGIEHSQLRSLARALVDLADQLHLEAN